MDIDYTLKVNEQEIDYIIEKKDGEKLSQEQLKRLKIYYYLFLKNNIITSNDEKKEKLLLKSLESLSEEGLVDMVIKSKSNKTEVTEAVNELIEAFGDEDLEDIVDEEINGNYFEFDKSFDIESYRKELYEIGERTKGQKWRLVLDDDGKVVLCE